MPSLSQIIPKYTVPHVQTYINDNSTVNDFVSVPVEEGTRHLCVFASSKGEDGVVKTFNDLGEFLDEYGTPNYALYGQPMYNAYAALNSGNAICHCMRVTPADAAYASLAVCARVKVEEDTTTSTSTFNMQVKFTADPVADNGNAITNKDELFAALESMGLDSATNTTLVDNDGFEVYPLFGIVAKGRGSYGNAISISIAPDTISNSENAFVNYILSVIDSSTGTPILKEQLRGSFYEDANTDSTSLLFDDVLADPDTGSSIIELVTYHTGWNNLIAKYNTDTNLAIADADKITLNSADIFAGALKDGAVISKFTLTTGTNAVTLNTATGVNLVGGNDGSFAADVDAATRLAAMNAEYIEAFTHKIAGGTTDSTRYDKAVLSKRRTPAELILDAGYDVSVKNALIQLGKKRYDAAVILDAGTDIQTYTQAINLFNGLDNTDDFIFGKECQHYKIRDPFTGKIIPVTYTYFLAGNLSSHLEVEGNYIPFVGADYSTLSGHIKNSLTPIIDADDLEVKEDLYKNHINFVECIAEDTFVRATQGTAQSATTDLSEQNNVFVILEMKRMLEEFVSARLYNFAEAEDRVLFTEAADRLFTTFTATKVRDYNVYFDMNAFEESRNILHCYLSVTFRTMAKRGIIEIDINKRV